MKKILQNLGITLLIMNSLAAQDCATQPFWYEDYVVSGNFTQKNSGDKVINDVVMLWNRQFMGDFKIDVLVSNGNGERILKNGTNFIDYDLANVNGRMLRGDFDNDGHIDDFILINKTGISSMRFDLFKSDGHSSHPTFTQSSVYSLNGYDPDKITGRVVSGDFDNDGYWDDIAAFYDYGNGETRIHTFRSNGSTFVYSSSQGWWNSTGYTATRVTDRVVSGDFDRDGTVDDIAAFYDYGNGETRIHVWLSGGTGFDYQSSIGWWGATGYTASKISKRVVSLNIDRDGKNYDDIAVFYDYNGIPTMHVFESNGSSFDYSGPSGWWTGSEITTSFFPNPIPDKADYLNGKLVDYDSRSSSLTPGKPSDIIGFHTHMNLRYRFWRAKKALLPKNRISHSQLRYCEPKNLNEESNDEIMISAYPNPTKSFTTIEMSDSLIDSTTEIQIHSLFGELVFSTQKISSKINIDLSRRKPGIYLVKVIGTRTNSVLKIVKE